MGVGRVREEGAAGVGLEAAAGAAVAATGGAEGVVGATGAAVVVVVGGEGAEGKRSEIYACSSLTLQSPVIMMAY